MKTLIVMPNGPMMYEQADKVWESLPESEKHVMTGKCYLHGQLDYDVQDLFMPVNAAELGLIRTRVNSNKKEYQFLSVNGKIPVKVMTVDKPCVGYFWEIPFIRDRTGKPVRYDQLGLICYEDDKEACEYAYQKMQEKSYDI